MLSPCGSKPLARTLLELNLVSPFWQALRNGYSTDPTREAWEANIPPDWIEARIKEKEEEIVGEKKYGDTQSKREITDNHWE